MKRFLSCISMLIVCLVLYADIDWQLEPLRITANAKSNATVFIICHMELNKPITVHYDVYNAQDSLLCQYTMTTPYDERGGDREQKGYLVGPDSLMLTDEWLTLDYGEPCAKLRPGYYVIAYGENPKGIGCNDYTHERHLTFNIKSGKVTLSGNIMSLIVGKDPARLDTANYIPSDVCFARLFNQNGNNTSDEILQILNGPTDASNLILPSKTLTHACYDRMFNSCTQLEFLPEIPATTMAYFSCLQMFGGCRAAKTPPVMAADTLAKNCFWHMFQECVQMKSAPEMPATVIERGCFHEMYKDCSKLREIRVNWDDWGPDCDNWVTGVAAKGTFYCPEGLELIYGMSNIPEGWTVETFDPTQPTAIEETETMTQTQTQTMSVKRLINGRIYILREGRMYDMMGNIVEE